MQISFRLCWLKPGSSPRRAFKQFPAYELFNEYLRRISKFCPINILGDYSADESKPVSKIVWLCSTAERGVSALSSEGLSKKMDQILSSAAKQLHIVIGGPDGISRDSISLWQPNLIWNFGPLTLPHELAAVVASEQIYRAWTILKGLPYHDAH